MYSDEYIYIWFKYNKYKLIALRNTAYLFSTLNFIFSSNNLLFCFSNIQFLHFLNVWFKTKIKTLWHK